MGVRRHKPCASIHAVFPQLTLRHKKSIPRNNKETFMKNPLDTLWGTVITGLVLTAVLYYVAKSLMGA